MLLNSTVYYSRTMSGVAIVAQIDFQNQIDFQHLFLVNGILKVYLLIFVLNMKFESLFEWNLESLFGAEWNLERAEWNLERNLESLFGAEWNLQWNLEWTFEAGS